MVLYEALPLEAYHFLFVFARIGAMVMVLPGFGETYVNTRIRLALAVLLTLVIQPIIPGLPALPPAPLVLVGDIIPELLIGVALGLFVRVLLFTAQIAGTIISMQVGLAMAMTFDPAQGVQGALLGTFLTLLATVLVFTTGLYQTMLMGLVASYDLAPAGEFLSVRDAAAAFVGFVAQIFRLAMQLAAPFLLFGFVFYVGIGILSKLMPQVQVFFIAIPANLLLGHGILMIGVGALMLALFSAYERHLRLIFGV
ncbi:MAG: flagellar biosynthetic protein FliR [Pseudomonadota bacterium]